MFVASSLFVDIRDIFVSFPASSYSSSSIDSGFIPASNATTISSFVTFSFFY